VDDIATHWWANLGYKYPPVHYYLTPAMKQNGTLMPSHIPALTYSGPATKTIPSSPSTQNESSTKSKPTTNGYQSTPRSHRLNNKIDQISKPSRRISRERYNGAISSKHPSRTQ
jgi:hypothetical protein